MLVAFFCYALPAQADQLAEANDNVLNDSTLNDSVLIDGDKLELHLERSMRAIGHASMRRGQQSVSGDVIDYDLQNDELHVTGNVAISLDNAKIEGSELRLQLSSQLGEFKNARFTMLPKSTAQPATFNSARIEAENATLMGNHSSPLDLPSKPISSATDVLGSLYLSTTFSSKKLTSQGRGDAKSVIFDGQDVKRFKEARYTTCAAGVDDG